MKREPLGSRFYMVGPIAILVAYLVGRRARPSVLPLGEPGREMSPHTTSGGVAAPGQNTADAELSDPVGKWLSGNALLILGATPIAFAAAKVFIFAAGDTAVLTALMSNLNITALLMGAILPFMGVIAYYVFLLAVDRVVEKISRGHENGFPDSVVAVLSLLIFVAVCGFPWWAIASFIVAAPGLIFLFRFVGKKLFDATSGSEGTRAWLVPAMIFASVMLVTVVSPIGVWLQAEAISVERDVYRSGYVLSEDADRLTVVWTDGGVESIDAGDIRERVICQVNSSGSEPLVFRLSDRGNLAHTEFCKDRVDKN